jgi:topoisomerase-4 subunit A
MLRAELEFQLKELEEKVFFSSLLKLFIQEGSTKASGL